MLIFQTYDLLRICVYGFHEFCRSFLERNPGYYIVPLKLNGSAVETLFSQFKHIAGGKLSSINYAQAKRTVMLRKDVRGQNRGNQGYRDVDLHVREAPLRRGDARRNLGLDRQ